MGSELVYTDHARDQMRDRTCSEAEVEHIIANPARGTYAPRVRDRIEHYGFASDGRAINVVTNRAKTVVITVVEQ